MTKEIIADKIILELDTSSFDGLTLSQKHLVHHLSLAGHAGRDLFYQQVSKYNLIVRQVLTKVYRSLTPEVMAEHESFNSYFKLFLLNNGLYDHNHNFKLPVPFSREDFTYLCSLSAISVSDMDICLNALFEKQKPYRTYKGFSDDILSQSAINFYDGVTQKEAQQFHKDNYPKDKYSSTYGINKRIVKSVNSLDGESAIHSEVISINGLYSQQVKNIVKHLESACEYAENEIQLASLVNLIQFYKTGDTYWFDQHCQYWVKDTQSTVYYINGFIENYLDPLGQACAFQSLVAIKRKDDTAMTEALVKNIQWFEDNLPVNPLYKRETVTTNPVYSLDVISFSGRVLPQLPRGINLPNAEWIREEMGSKSVSLNNVMQAQDLGDKTILNEFILPEYHGIIEKYASKATLLQLHMHESVGHALGKLAPHVKNSDLKECSSTIEEMRADVNAIYFMFDPKLKEMGIVDKSVDQEQLITAFLVNYFTTSDMTQLHRVDRKMTELSQVHMQNRQGIAKWVLEYTKGCKSIQWKADAKGNKFISINSLSGIREAFKTLVTTLQSIKSEGDYTSAKSLVEKYATYIDIDTHNEVNRRLEGKTIPSWTAFICPIIKPIVDNGKAIDYYAHNNYSFLQNQLTLDALI